MKTVKYTLILAFILLPKFAFSIGAVSNYCEDGNKQVQTGGQSSSTRVQRSYPLCTVTVYVTGTVTKPTLYSDANNTPLTNPFTASATGLWQFFTNDGAYDVVLSGAGISAPFTRYYQVVSDPIRQWANSVRIVDGVRFTSVEAAYQDLPAVGGWVYVPASFTDTVQVVLIAGKPLHLTCASRDTVNITYNAAANFYIDTAAGTTVVNSGSIENCSFTTGSTALGFMRIGNPATNFDESYFRTSWLFSNFTIYGPGASTAGKVGMSLTQIIAANFYNVYIRNYETGYIEDRGGNNHWYGGRIWSFKNGANMTVRAGSGSAPASGLSMSVFSGTEFNGPTVGPGGYCLIVDRGNIHVEYVLFEPQNAAQPAAGMAHITANGYFYTEKGVDFSSDNPALNPTNLFVLDDDFINPDFGSDLTTVFTFNPILAGTPNAINTGNRMVCNGVSPLMWTYCYGMGTNKAIAWGQSSDNVYSLSADAFKYYGAGGGKVMDFSASTGAIAGIPTSFQDASTNTFPVIVKHKLNNTNGQFVGVSWAGTDGTTLGDIKNIRDEGISGFDMAIETLGFGGTLQEAVRFTGLNNFPKMEVRGGIQAAAANPALQHKRTGTGVVVAGAQTTITVTWDVAFTDTSYTPVCSVTETTNENNLEVLKIQAIAAGTLSVRVINNAGVDRTGTVLCHGMHD